MPPLGDHAVCFHDDSAGLAREIATHIEPALSAGSAALLIMRAERLDAVRSALSRSGFAVDALLASGQLTWLDARKTLGLLDGPEGISERRFTDILGATVERLNNSWRHTRAFGELVDVLEEQERHHTALELEAKWIGLQSRLAFDLLCGYELARFGCGTDAFEQVCDHHSTVFSARDGTDDGDPQRLIARLRHQVQVLSQRSECTGSATAGRLVNIVLHDIGNVLTAIHWSAREMEPFLPQSGPSREALEEIDDAVGRCANLVRDVMHLGRPAPPSPALLDTLVSNQLRLLSRIVTGHARLEVELGSPSTVLLSPTEAMQILTNLVVNARQAVTTGGIIAIRTTTEGRQHEGSARHFAVLEVTDNGAGMDGATRLRAFEERFTTRGESNGSGLGLFIVQDIIRRAGGAVEVDSEPGRGTTFRVLLPQLGSLQS